MPTNLLIIHYDYLQNVNDRIIFIITQVIFRHLFSVGIGDELLRVCHNFNYPIQCTKFILSTFLRSEMQSLIEVMCLAHA